jgi:predicted Ser/Thr protein kinase
MGNVNCSSKKSTIDGVPREVAQQALKVFNPMMMAHTDEESSGTEGMSSGTDEETKTILNDPNHGLHLAVTRLYRRNQSHKTRAKSHKHASRHHKAKAEKLARELSANRRATVAAETDAEKLARELSANRRATLQMVKDHQTAAYNLAREVSTSKRATVHEQAARKAAEQMVAKLRELLTLAKGENDNLAKKINKRVGVWEGLLGDPGMLFYNSTSPTPSSSSAFGTVRCELPKVETWADPLTDIPATCLHREGKWAFVNAEQRAPECETEIQVFFVSYMSNVLRAIKYMWDDSMGAPPELTVGIEVSDDDLLGLRVDICLMSTNGKVLIPIEMKVTGKWFHTWKLLQPVLTKKKVLSEKYGHLTGPLSLAELVELEKELQDVNRTDTLRESMLAPIRQVYTYAGLKGTRYLILSTGEYSYLCRRTDDDVLEVRDVLRHREWNNVVNGEVPAQQMAHFLIHVLTAKDKYMTPLSEENRESLQNVAADERKRQRKRKDESKKKDTKGNTKGDDQQGDSSSSGRRPTGGGGSKKTVKDRNLKQDGAGGYTFRGLKIDASPGVDVYTALSLEYEKECGDTVIGQFRTGPAYRARFKGKPVVVKVAHTAKDKYLVPELKNEMRMYEKLSALQGDVLPNLVYAGPMLAGRTAIATSDCGVPLDEWAKTASPEDLAIVAAEARRKLRKLHDAGVLHGDIKPLNIAVDCDRKVSLIDLAFALELGGANAPEAEAEREALDAELRYIGA